MLSEGFLRDSFYPVFLLTLFFFMYLFVPIGVNRYIGGN